mmetsp:Transcript_31209/g.72157  ORF Transcript_31209/g.72157 Transcript_31209/m.72157 type:complete len:82 (+) Transcript_31209:22-267(+)
MDRANGETPGVSLTALEATIQRMTDALRLARQREEVYLSSSDARAAAEKELRRECDELRGTAAKLWADVQSLQRTLQDSQR